MECGNPPVYHLPVYTLLLHITHSGMVDMQTKPKLRNYSDARVSLPTSSVAALAARAVAMSRSNVQNKRRAIDDMRKMVARRPGSAVQVEQRREAQFEVPEAVRHAGESHTQAATAAQAPSPCPVTNALGCPAVESGGHINSAGPDAEYSHAFRTPSPVRIAIDPELGNLRSLCPQASLTPRRCAVNTQLRTLRLVCEWAATLTTMMIVSAALLAEEAPLVHGGRGYVLLLRGVGPPPVQRWGRVVADLATVVSTAWDVLGRSAVRVEGGLQLMYIVACWLLLCIDVLRFVLEDGGDMSKKRR